MGRRQPEGPAPAPAVQRVRIRYAKRGRLRFCSHRDFARAFERALRRAEVPMAYSAGFHPHPKISYVGAAPTGVGSEAEYLEIALAVTCSLPELHQLLDAAMPDGLDIVDLIDVEQCPPGSLTDLMQVSLWRLELSDDASVVRAAVHQLLAAGSAVVTRLTKQGARELDARAALISAEVQVEQTAPANAAAGGPQVGEPSDSPQRAILDLVVRQVSPSVRPDDVLAALNLVAGFAPSRPPRVTRVAQGPLAGSGTVVDPFGGVSRVPEISASA